MGLRVSLPGEEDFFDDSSMEQYLTGEAVNTVQT